MQVRSWQPTRPSLNLRSRLQIRKMALAKAHSPPRKLYELCGAEDARKTSPFCWRIRFSLRHKGLAYESIPWRRVEKDAISFTGQGKVSVL